MASGLRLDLRQTRSLVMTPQLRQAIKLLVLSNLEIEAFIGEALDANPLLDIDPAALDRDRHTGEGGGDHGGDLRFAPAGEGIPIDERGAGEATLAEHLEAQIGAVTSDPRLAAIARYLIRQLDEAGYLPVPLRDIADDLGLPLMEVEDGLVLLQTLDPTGIGARSPGECIALQAKEADRYDPCMARLIDNLDLLARGELARLKRLCGVDDEDFADMLAELRGYDPKPGLRFGGDAAMPVTPDILITARADGGWDIALDQATLPRLIVNRACYVELRNACADKPSKGWLSEKLADAIWLVKALDQRQKTILKVAAEIVRRQDGFFRHGVSQLRPLTLRAVAEAIGLHESTVSRVTANKYFRCERGIFALKYVFTSGVATAGGQGTASAEAVKAAIRSLIDAENPGEILSDDALTDLLRGQGFDLARRTVAKYREAIGLGSSVCRRRQKALAAVR
ncbi:MAG: RNA polymerase factor sigma-54 [Novosphingobium sp.]|jgi:RNA polymerase sigma-54 factor|nr:RNA polymerase factor sigma-54 [Novosphingobium sp.]